MPFAKKLKITALIGLMGLLLPSLGMADTTWTWKFGKHDGGCEGPGCSSYSLQKTFNPVGSATSPDVTASGWASTAGSNDELAPANIYRYSGGLGITHNENDGQHGVDNIGRLELVLFDFGDKSVSLTELSLGWVSRDTDISVLAYTGGGVPTLSGVSYSGTDEGLTGAGGWQMIGNYDVDGYYNDIGSGSVNYAQTIDSGNTKSSYWIVAAYNDQFGPDCNPTGYCDEGNDYFKIRSLTAKHRHEPPPPNEVPIPSTLFLSALGITLLVRRKLQQA